MLNCTKAFKIVDEQKISNIHADNKSGNTFQEMRYLIQNNQGII